MKMRLMAVAVSWFAIPAPWAGKCLVSIGQAASGTRRERQHVGLGESWSARSDHTPVEHLPHTHGPTQLGSFVNNVVTRHDRQRLDTSLGQQCRTPHGPFDITGPDPPGNLNHEVDLDTILTPLAPDHNIGPADLIGAFL